MNRADRAEELFRQGYNCSQAVAGAFCESFGMDMDTVLRLSCPFGGGLGRMRQVCGAVSGMAMVAGMVNGNTVGGDQQAKGENYKLVQRMAARFEEQNGSIICRELLGLQTKPKETSVPSARSEEYYKKRPCVQLVRDAAAIAGEFCCPSGEKPDGMDNGSGAETEVSDNC